jgi:pSer/pThr/pTyr-binding forkhead associated (FHA) protein
MTMGAEGLVLIGVRGVVEGEQFSLEDGKSVVIGRSRECDISLRDCKKWEELEARGELPEDGSKTVSRKHLKITVYDVGRVELEDLSSNGTFVDGKRIDRMVLNDMKDASHELLLGAGEGFRLEWR